MGSNQESGMTMNESKSASFLKVGELAERAGVGVQTLHYYERLRLLPKPDRSAANYRLYPADALRRVQFIKKAQVLGFTLEEIKDILGLREQGRELAYSLRKVPSTGPSIDLAHAPRPTLSPKDPGFEAEWRANAERQFQIAPVK